MISFVTSSQNLFSNTFARPDAKGELDERCLTDYLRVSPFEFSINLAMKATTCRSTLMKLFRSAAYDVSNGINDLKYHIKRFSLTQSACVDSWRSECHPWQHPAHWQSP